MCTRCSSGSVVCCCCLVCHKPIAANALLYKRMISRNFPLMPPSCALKRAVLCTKKPPRGMLSLHSGSVVVVVLVVVVVVATVAVVAVVIVIEVVLVAVGDCQ
jgi:hypothetical protein